MQRSILPDLVLAAILVCAYGAPAYAEDPEISLSLGGSQIFFEDAENDDPFEEEWGFRIEPAFMLSPFSQKPELRMGGGVAFAFYSDDADLGFVTVDSDLSLITPEFLISWRERLGEKFYIEPGLGLGWMFGELDTLFDNESGNGYSVRPYVRVGYQMERWAVGVEAGYRFGELEFDEAEGDIEELNVGLFLSFKT